MHIEILWFLSAFDFTSFVTDIFKKFKKLYFQKIQKIILYSLDIRICKNLFLVERVKLNDWSLLDPSLYFQG